MGISATVVELDRRSVGIAVRTRSGFLFFSAGGEFAHLDKRNFPRLASIYRAITLSREDRKLQKTN